MSSLVLKKLNFTTKHGASSILRKHSTKIFIKTFLFLKKQVYRNCTKNMGDSSGCCLYLLKVEIDRLLAAFNYKNIFMWQNLNPYYEFQITRKFWIFFEVICTKVALLTRVLQNRCSKKTRHLGTVSFLLWFFQAFSEQLFFRRPLNNWIFQTPKTELFWEK